VIADAQIVEHQAPLQIAVHRLDGLTRLDAGADVGLVGRDNRQEPGRAQRAHRLLDTVAQAQRLD